MDPLTEILDAPRARGAFLLRVTMAAPWSVRIQDRAPLAVVAMLSGRACYRPDDGAPVDLQSGDVLVIASPEPYLFADRPDRQPQVTVHPGGRCETLAGTSLDLPLRQGVRTWGNAAEGTDVMLVGSYVGAAEVGSRILDVLPSAFVLRADEWQSPLVGLLAEEAGSDRIGMSSLLDRLLDALVIAAVRHWIAANDEHGPAWVRARSDPQVRGALERIHDDPQQPWTMDSLAAEVGLSKAALSRKFTAAVGEPPMSYLAGWRLALAADRLHDADQSVSQIARAVGYSSPFTFSAAFKRRYGVSPQSYRDRPAVEVDQEVRSQR